MFACIVPGYPVNYMSAIDVESPKPLEWGTEIPNPTGMPGFGISMLKWDVPPGYAAGIFYSIPTKRRILNDKRLEDWTYVGMVSKSKTNDFFHSPWGAKLPRTTTKVKILVKLQETEKLVEYHEGKKFIMNKSSKDSMDDKIENLLNETDPKKDKKQLNSLWNTYRSQIMKWKSSDKHGHNLLHSLVLKGKAAAIELLVSLPGTEINVQRDSDRCTPLHLAIWRRNAGMITLLQRLGANTKITNKYGESCEQLLEKREKMSNLVWMDLELTSLEDPHILECAVIITDKELNEIPESRGHWVIHHKKSEMDQLSSWHQNTFASRPQGNGLLEDVAKSKLTLAHFQTELLQLLRKYCVEGQNSLAGSSVHCDREVLRQRTPAIFKFLSHRIIDVSTLHGLAERWIPNKLSKMSGAGQGNHRAMVDIESSINLLKWHRKNFLQDDDDDNGSKNQ